MSKPRAVLFDLDGTLADTAQDLVACMNRLLLAEGRPELPFEQLRPTATHGSTAMLKEAFGITPEDTAFKDLQTRFLDSYAAHIADRTTLFDGMDELLTRLEQAVIPWGIVTNKPARFTDPLVKALGLDQRAGCCISGDTCSQSKPHPEPLYCAAEQLNVAAEDCVYVGDAARDMEAARAAGMQAVAALWGYISPDDDVDHWNADTRIDHPLDLAP